MFKTPSRIQATKKFNQNYRQIFYRVPWDFFGHFQVEEEEKRREGERRRRRRRREREEEEEERREKVSTTYINTSSLNNF